MAKKVFDLDEKYSPSMSDQANTLKPKAKKVFDLDINYFETPEYQQSVDVANNSYRFQEQNLFKPSTPIPTLTPTPTSIPTQRPSFSMPDNATIKPLAPILKPEVKPTENTTFSQKFLKVLQAIEENPVVNYLSGIGSTAESTLGITALRNKLGQSEIASNIGQQAEQFKQQHPISAAATEIGSYFLPIGAGAKVLSKVPYLGKVAAPLAAAGFETAKGALEGKSTTDIAKSATSAAAFMGVGGVATGALEKVGTKILQNAPQVLKNSIAAELTKNIFAGSTGGVVGGVVAGQINKPGELPKPKDVLYDAVLMGVMHGFNAIPNTLAQAKGVSQQIKVDTQNLAKVIDVLNTKAAAEPSVEGKIQYYNEMRNGIDTSLSNLYDNRFVGNNKEVNNIQEALFFGRNALDKKISDLTDQLNKRLPDPTTGIKPTEIVPTTTKPFDMQAQTGTPSFVPQQNQFQNMVNKLPRFPLQQLPQPQAKAETITPTISTRDTNILPAPKEGVKTQATTNVIPGQTKDNIIESTANAIGKPAVFKGDIFKISTKDGKVDVPGKSYKGLSVHPNIKTTSPLVFGKEYTVTHKDSGEALRTFRTEKDARLYAQSIANSIDTTKPIQEFTKYFDDDFRTFNNDLISWISNKDNTKAIPNSDVLSKAVNNVAKETMSPEKLIDQILYQGNIVHGFDYSMRKQIAEELIKGIVEKDKMIKIDVRGDGHLEIYNKPDAITTVLDRLKIKLETESKLPIYVKGQSPIGGEKPKSQPPIADEEKTTMASQLTAEDNIRIKNAGQKAYDMAMAQKPGKTPTGGYITKTDILNQAKTKKRNARSEEMAKIWKEKELAKKAAQETTQETRKPSLPIIEDFFKRIYRGEAISLEQFKSDVSDILDYEKSIKDDLAKLTIKDLKNIIRSYRASGEKKDDYIKTIYRDYLSNIYYAITGNNSITYGFGKESYEDMLRKKIDANIKLLTPEKWSELQSKYKADFDAGVEKKKKQVEAFKTPQTLEDFRLKKRIAKLTPEEQIKYDELFSLDKKARELENKQKIKTLPTVSTDNFNIIEDVDTRDNSKLWVIKFKDRVDKDTFSDTRDNFKKFGIGYSRFKGGFISNVNPEEIVKQITGQSPTENKIVATEKNNAQKLSELADNMQKEIDDLKRPRLENTARRANMASGAMEKAKALENTQSTLRNLSDAMEKGKLRFLDKLDSRVQIRTLSSVLTRAKVKYSDEKLSAIRNDYQKWKEARANIKDSEAIQYAELPQETIYSERLKDIVNKIDGKKGYVLISNRFKKLIENVKEPRDIKLSESARQDLEKVIKEVETFNFLDDELSDRKRLQRMGIDTKEELRASLREFIEYKEAPGAVSKEEIVKGMERELIGRKIEGYFPTPKNIVEKMLDFADIKPGEKVLEPSAGKGNIADLIQSKEPNANLDVIEIQPALRTILEAKGHKLVDRNFLEHDGAYDKIIMNPPFEKHQDIDHVQKAYSMLNDGGKLVAIMSESPFSNSDKKSDNFRNWLTDVGGESERLPEGSFKSSERPTGVNVRIVYIEKPKILTKSADIKAELEKNFPANAESEEGRKDLDTATAAITDLQKIGSNNKGNNLSGNGGTLAGNTGKYKTRTIGNAISIKAIKTGRIQIKGATVKNEYDLAVIAQAYRDPRFETMRYIFVKDGKVVHYEGVSSYIAGTCHVNPYLRPLSEYQKFGKEGLHAENDLRKLDFEKWNDELKGIIKKHGADGYYLLHNHPSGLVEASQADIEATNQIEKNVPGLISHVIIDSNKYFVIKKQADGAYTGTTKEAVFHEKDIIKTPSKDHPLLNKTIDSAPVLGKIALEIKNNKDYTTILYVDAQNSIVGIQETPNAMIQDVQSFKDFLTPQNLKFGSSRTFLVTTNNEIFNSLDKSLITDGFIIDAAYINPDKKVDSYRAINTQISDKKDWWMGKNLNEYRPHRVKEKTARYNAAPFFSKLQQVIADKMPNKADKELIYNLISKNGVKPEEIKWSGLNDFLKGKDRIDKQELLEYLRLNELTIAEVLRTKDATINYSEVDKAYLEHLSKRIENKSVELLDLLKGDERFLTVLGEGDWYRAEKILLERVKDDMQLEKGLDLIQEIEKAENEQKKIAYKYPKPSTPVYEQYQVKGGENYRELLFQLPISKKLPPGIFTKKLDNGKWTIINKEGETYGTYDSESEAIDLVLKTQPANLVGQYQSSHWEEPNILAHVRLNNRVDADGKKVLFAEEIQSDWHQEGRNKGYKELDLTAEEKELQELNEQSWKRELTEKEENRRQELKVIAQKSLSEKVRKSGPIPDAPFRKTWHEFVLKRLIRYAAENGYDKIAWTPGEVQNKRYDLRKQIKEIAYWKDGEQIGISVSDLRGNPIIDQKFYSPNELENVFGIEIANKIMNDEGVDDPIDFPDTKEARNGGVRYINDSNLEIGGSGMKGFYDKIIPNFLNQYGKRWQTKVEEIELKTDRSTFKAQALPITDSMKESVLREGQALFEKKKDYEVKNEPLTSPSHIELPPASGDNTSGEAKRASEIIKEFEERFLNKVRVGKINRRSVLGYMQIKSHVIRLRKANDIPTFTHEAGHLIDKIYNWKLSKISEIKKSGLNASKINAELQALGKNTTRSKKEATLRIEGAAEFMRLFLTDQPQAFARAPETYEYYKKVIDPDLMQFLDAKMQDIWNLTNLKPEDRVMRDVWDKAEVDKAKSKEAGLKLKLEQFYTQTVDEYFPLIKDSKILAGEEGQKKIKQTIAQYRGYESTAMFQINPKGIDGMYQSDLYGNKVGPSLFDILEPLSNNQKKQDYFWKSYVIARRAEDYHARKLELPNDINTYRETVKNLEIKYPDFPEIFKKVRHFDDNLLKILVQAEFFTPEQATKIREENPNHIHLFRVIDDNTVGLKTSNKNPVKKLKGGGQEILNPYESMVNMTFVMWGAAKRQQLLLEMAKLADKAEGQGAIMVKSPYQLKVTEFNLKEVENQIIEALLEKGVNLEDFYQGFNIKLDLDTMAKIFRPNLMAKNNQLAIYKKGKVVLYDVEPELYKALSGMNPVTLNATFQFVQNALMKLGDFQAASILYTPRFVVHNTFREVLTSWLQSRAGISILDILKGGMSVMKHDKWFLEAVKRGGTTEMFLANEAKFAQKVIDELSMGRSMAKRTFHALKHPLNTLREAIQFTELGTKTAEAKKTIENRLLKRFADSIGKKVFITKILKFIDPNIRRQWKTFFDITNTKVEDWNEAIFNMRDLSYDIKRKGRTVRELNINRIWRFFNSYVQGMDQAVRTASEPKRLKKLLIRGVMLSLFTMFMYSLVKDNKWYKNLKPFQRDNYWNIPIGDPKTTKTFLPVPRGFEWAIPFMAVPERAMDYFWQDNPKAWEGFSTSLQNNFLFEVDPMPLRPFIEQATNTTWQGIPIENYGDKQVSPEFRYDERTSSIAKSISGITSKIPYDIESIQSPKRIDHLIRGFTGTLGQYGVSAIDELAGKPNYRASDMLNDVPYLKTIRNVPGVNSILGAFFLDASKSNIIREKYYEGMNKANIDVADIKRSGEVTPERAEGVVLDKVYTKFDTAIKKLNKLRDTVAKIKTDEARSQVKKIDEAILQMQTDMNYIADKIHQNLQNQK